MKVNPLGISAYTRIDSAKSGVTKQDRSGAVADADKRTAPEDALTLKPQSSSTESAVAIRMSSEMSSMISPEERAAIEMLFERYASRQESAVSYDAGGVTQSGPKLGARVDFRA